MTPAGRQEEPERVGQRLRVFCLFCPLLVFPWAQNSVHTAQRHRFLSLVADAAGHPDPSGRARVLALRSSPYPVAGARPWAEWKSSHLQGHRPHLAGARVSGAPPCSAPGPVPSASSFPFPQRAPSLSLPKEPWTALCLGNLTQGQPVPLRRPRYSMHLLLPVSLSSSRDFPLLLFPSILRPPSEDRLEGHFFPALAAHAFWFLCLTIQEAVFQKGNGSLQRSKGGPSVHLMEQPLVQGRGG